MTSSATLANIERKSAWVDSVQLDGDGKPLPSWIELNPTELCNRACSFCPRVDPAKYPNQPLEMSLELATKLGDELEAVTYEGAVVLSGFGEPMLHSSLPTLVACLGDVRVELVTNGDFLGADSVRALADAGLDHFVVSLYDGKHQVEAMTAVFDAAGVPIDDYTLRDRWHGAEQDYGLKLTNRAGRVETGNQPASDPDRPCWYLAYSMMIDWNGDVLLCCQDWNKGLRFGNLHDQGLIEVWQSSAMRKRRMQLLRGRGGLSPCQGCNADGMVHGANHVAAWQGR